MFSKLYLSCYEHGHNWNPNCNAVAWEVFQLIFSKALRLYSSIHVAAHLVRIISNPSGVWKEGIGRFLLKLISAILRSSLFLGLNGSLFIVFFCRLRGLLGYFTYPTIAFLPGLLSSAIAVQFERDTRVPMLALYLTNLSLGTLFNTLVSLGITNGIPYGDVIIFCIATASLMYLYRKRVGLGPSLKSLIKFFIGQDKYEDNQLNVEPYNLPVIGLIQQSINKLYNYPILGRITFTLQGFLRGFSTGFAISSLFAIFKNMKQLGRNPARVIQAIFSKKNMGLPMFLGSLVGIYKAVTSFLHWLHGKHSEWHGALAGGLCGTSLVFYRSGTIALYFLLKSLEAYYKLGIDYGHLPSIKHFDIALYSLATAIVFNYAIISPQYLRGSYQRFIVQVTKDRVTIISGNMTKALQAAFAK
ncbi:Transmembrane protein 135 [Trichoplax sp. H2]|nr:Transmembrane protein 135 [Trichoplax sp. H2]|eukprot:RDD41834.1 Transmembrane protein 135 [Trichoplax sp. H2]